MDEPNVVDSPSPSSKWPTLKQISDYSKQTLTTSDPPSSPAVVAQRRTRWPTVDRVRDLVNRQAPEEASSPSKWPSNERTNDGNKEGTTPTSKWPSLQRISEYRKTPSEASSQRPVVATEYEEYESPVKPSKERLNPEQEIIQLKRAMKVGWTARWYLRVFIMLVVVGFGQSTKS